MLPALTSPIFTPSSNTMPWLFKIRSISFDTDSSQPGRVAEIIAGQAGHLNYNTIPSIVYTSPEVAWVGKTEQDLKREGVAYKSGQFPFSANGRALCNGDTQGFVKVLAEAKSDRVLGIHIVGTLASEMIGEAAMADAPSIQWQ